MPPQACGRRAFTYLDLDFLLLPNTPQGILTYL